MRRRKEKGIDDCGEGSKVRPFLPSTIAHLLAPSPWQQDLGHLACSLQTCCSRNQWYLAHAELHGWTLQSRGEIEKQRNTQPHKLKLKSIEHSALRGISCFDLRTVQFLFVWQPGVLPPLLPPPSQPTSSFFVPCERERSLLSGGASTGRLGQAAPAEPHSVEYRSWQG